MNARQFIKNYLKLCFQKTNVITGIVLVFLLGSALVYAIQLTNNLITFNEGTTASANEVNSNFQTLASAIDKEREGIACLVQSSFEIPDSSSSEILFEDNCTIVADFRPYSGANLFNVTEDGIYQIHRNVLYTYYGSSSANPDTSHMWTRIYIDGASISSSDPREIFQLNAGQSIDIKVFDYVYYGSSYYIQPESIVFVKRIF
jgi:hypothetical protein